MTDGQLADLNDSYWHVKYVAAKVIPDENQLSSFMAVTDPAKFAGEDGALDEAKLLNALTSFYGGQPSQQPPKQWGQSSGQPAGQQPGADGAAALKRRWGVGKDNPNEPSTGGQIPHGRSAKAELAKRYGSKK
jgi:hypothetical protein